MTSNSLEYPADPFSPSISPSPQAELARVLRLETMLSVRETVDAAEGVCPAELWTLATYKELLFLDQHE